MSGFQMYGDFNHPDFRFFAKHFLAFRPDLVELFAHQETGPISPDFLIAAWLGQISRSQATLASRAYLYYAGKMVLRVDLATGALCALRGGSAWVKGVF